MQSVRFWDKVHALPVFLFREKMYAKYNKNGKNK